MEIWKNIPGYSEYYQVSDLGRVRRVAGVIIRNNGRPQTIHARILRTSTDEWGYPMVSVDGKTKKIHSLVARAFLGERPFDGAVIRHLDGDPASNRVSNLAYGTASENVLDGYQYNKGFIKRGQKLTEADALEIKRRLSLGERARGLAKAFGVSEQTICDIKHGRIYRRVII